MLIVKIRTLDLLIVVTGCIHCLKYQIAIVMEIKGQTLWGASNIYLITYVMGVMN